MGILDELHGGGEPKPFNDDMVRRNGIPEAAFRLLHDICYHHDGRDVYDYVKRAQEILSTVPATGAKPPQGGATAISDLVEKHYAKINDFTHATIRGALGAIATEAFNLAATPTQGSTGGWVSVEDRLPNHAQEVLLTNGRARFVGAYHAFCHNPWVHTASVDPIQLADGETIKFWRELPAPPVTDAVKQEREG